jgi:TM2 domain-containing membrane protein YozV
MKIYDENGKQIQNLNIPDPNIAMMLSILLPGWGQLYCGKITRGIMIFITTTILIFVLIGAFEYIWQVWDAKRIATEY